MKHQKRHIKLQLKGHILLMTGRRIMKSWKVHNNSIKFRYGLTILS